MPQVKVRFFGFRSASSDFETQTRVVDDGITVGDLWDELRSSSSTGHLLSQVDDRTVAVLVNQQVVDRDLMQDIVLREGDTVTFMVFVMGG
ncbi:MAG TPA: MoaD/ThiS family protein [Anaerolineae bacterium]|jgi:thiamine biosynthesis protein ThiS|nr:MoaD/ThiS family protein [Anaerolineae bacterium]